MVRICQVVLWSSILWICTVSIAQDSKEYIIAARRTGIIEFIEPSSLKTISSIETGVARNSTGLNGVSANPDGQTIYIEGPIGVKSLEANNCCWLYSIDLATLQAKVVADIWGTKSRRFFVNSGPSLMQPVSGAVEGATEKIEGDHWQASSDGRWWFGLRNGPTLDLYDVARGEVSRSLTAVGMAESSPVNGVWLGNEFYVYTIRNASGRLWRLSPESVQLGAGIPLPQLADVPGCQIEGLIEITTAGDRLVLYENFGGKIDRRSRCDGVPGGAWVLNPATGRVVVQIAPHLYFWNLIPNRAGSELYGITSEAAGTQGPAELVRVDAHSGSVLQSRSLESDYWWISVATLRSIPSHNITISLAADRLP
jgi:hypothetical protein